MTIDLEKLKAEEAALTAEFEEAKDEIEIQAARRDRAEARLRVIADLIRLGEMYARGEAPPEIPL